MCRPTEIDHRGRSPELSGWEGAVLTSGKVVSQRKVLVAYPYPYEEGKAI